MGNWRITIEGTGAHHNGVKAIVKYEDGHDGVVHGGLQMEHEADSPGWFYVDKDGKRVELIRWESNIPYDADVVFKRVVEELKKFHTIHSAKLELLGQVEYANVQKLQDLSGSIPA